MESTSSAEIPTQLSLRQQGVGSKGLAGEVRLLQHGDADLVGLLDLVSGRQHLISGHEW